MNEIRGGKRSKKRGKSKNKEFMDAALDAFIRDQSLKKWREVDGLREGAEIDSLKAVKSSAEFIEKGPYSNIWGRWWKQDVIDHLPSSNEHLFGRIENAVRGAVLEEREERKNQADALLEDSFVYKEFIARQMEHLLFEAGGDIEEDI